MAEHENAVKIAVLEEQIKGLREQASSHARDNREQVSVLARDTRERFDKMDVRASYMEEKLDTLVEAFNKGKGAYAALIVVGGLIGAIAVKGAGAIIQWVGRL